MRPEFVKNRIKIAAAFTIAFAALSCVAIYFLLPQEVKWIFSSFIDIPNCTSRIADELEIQPDIGVVTEYLIQSVSPGMTQDEVEATLTKVAPISIAHTFTDDDQHINQQVSVRICDNPLGNILLFVSYSKDGHLINVVDAYAE